jgi:dethiobiotin synthetase
MSLHDLFVTGTDTDVGKTVLAATLCAGLRRPYWKPIQTGTRDGTDRASVIRYAGIPETHAFPEIYQFEPPVSPHLAAQLAGRRIDLKEIRRPQTDMPLIIEGAGGALVPLNDRDLMIDLMRELKAPVIVAARSTLGTINHTLLTVRALRDSGLTIRGIVMIGEPNEENRLAIEHYGDVKVIGRIPRLASIHREILLRVFEENFDEAALIQ